MPLSLKIQEAVLEIVFINNVYFHALFSILVEYEQADVVHRSRYTSCTVLLLASPGNCLFFVIVYLMPKLVCVSMESHTLATLVDFAKTR